MAAHTGLPYYVVTPENDIHNILQTIPGNAVQVAHRDGKTGSVKYIALVHDGVMPALENAQFIVRACNNLDALISAGNDVVKMVKILDEAIDNAIKS